MFIGPPFAAMPLAGVVDYAAAALVINITAGVQTWLGNRPMNVHPVYTEPYVLQCRVFLGSRLPPPPQPESGPGWVTGTESVHMPHRRCMRAEPVTAAPCLHSQLRFIALLKQAF